VVEHQVERRRVDRRVVVAECRIEGLSSRASIRVTDLSIHGGYVDTNAHCRPGDRVELTMLLDGHEVSVAGRVIHAQAGVGFGFAINTDDSPESARQRIADFCAPTAV
jgi:hypothetical protein